MSNLGKQFEKDWEDSYAKTSFFYLRLIDTAKWNKGDTKTMFTPSNPCDAVQFTMPFIWMLELKSTEGSSVSFFPNTPWERPKTDKKTQKMIKPYQVKKLMEFDGTEGLLGGFILNFRPRELKTGWTENQCYFVHIRDFVEFAKTSGKSSIGIEDCKRIGVLIENEKKKVHYRYDVSGFAEKAIVYYLIKEYLNKDYLIKIKNWLEWILIPTDTGSTPVCVPDIKQGRSCI